MSLHVHGMAGDLVAPYWPPLTHPEISRVLGDYGLTAPRVTWRSPRPLSAAALVDTASGPVFVKRHAAVVRDVAALGEEHAFADHLRARGVPVPAVLADRTGRRAVADGRWTWEVHAVGAGSDRYRDVASWQPCVAASDAHALGAALARVSLAAADFAAASRPPRLLVASWNVLASSDLIGALEQHVQERPLLQQALATRPWRRDAEQVLAPLHAQLVAHLPALPPGWTHGDGHPSNVLWEGPRVTDVIDLGLADRTTALFDLATAIERSCISWLDRQPRARPDLVGALVAGWSSERPLSTDERGALAALLPLVHLEFALSELAYFTGVTGSESDAVLAYDGYLLRHARWFASPAGQQLRQQVAAG
jgi:Ser/Thr protein kinase RdoA (MazF antagonist)